MFKIILYRPQIPPNTGNIIRLCANSGTELHLVHPLGFRVDQKSCRRAGLDYRELAGVVQHDCLETCLDRLGHPRLWAVTKFARQRYDEARFARGDAFLFGSETDGLPTEIHQGVAAELKIGLPMRIGNRSINLANAVSIITYEAWRQLGFAGMVDASAYGAQA